MRRGEGGGGRGRISVELGFSEAREEEGKEEPKLLQWHQQRAASNTRRI